jgi:hypothetical protein
MAQSNRLTGRASQSSLEATTPSSPGYDGGAHFRLYGHQGCKKSAGIELLVNNMFGDNILSIIKTNYIL